MNYFITGTDTGAGKTYVTALLLQSLIAEGRSAAGFKPISCGDREDAEALFDKVLGSAARKGRVLRRTRISSTDVWGVHGWLRGPMGAVRRAAWVSNFRGQTRVGVGAAAGRLAAFLPRY